MSGSSTASPRPVDDDLSQVVLHPGAATAPADRTPVAQSTAQQQLRQPGRKLLMAWLLLLLNREAAHGYELRRQLEARGVPTDTGALYRALRELERAGCAASSWAESAGGPRRRLYHLTAKGRHELGERVKAITATPDVHAAFVAAHDDARP